MTWINYRFGFRQFGILPEERLEIFLLGQPEPEVLSGVRVLGCILKIVLEAGEERDRRMNFKGTRRDGLSKISLYAIIFLLE